MKRSRLIRAEDSRLVVVDVQQRLVPAIHDIEVHVCVLQSALGLAAGGAEVYVVADAVGSRDPANRPLALERMRQAGVAIVSREMVAFEWLHRADDDRFRAVHREFLR